MSEIYGRPSNLAFQYDAYVVARTSAGADVFAGDKELVAKLKRPFINAETILETAAGSSRSGAIRAVDKNRRFAIEDADGGGLGVLSPHQSFLGFRSFDLDINGHFSEPRVVDFEHEFSKASLWKRMLTCRQNNFTLLLNGVPLARTQDRHTALRRGIFIDFTDSDDVRLDRRLGICVAYALLVINK